MSRHRRPGTPQHEDMGLTQEHLDMIADGVLRIGQSFGPSHEDDTEQSSGTD